MRAFERILQLGFQDDHELMLQIGRALFREGLIAPAHRFFDLAASAHPDSPDAAACLATPHIGWATTPGSLYWLRRALEIDAGYSEARIYLANLLYDRGETEAALHHLERTQPEDHFDELGIWRHIELKKTIYRLPDEDPELTPWLTRLGEVAGEPDPIDMLLAEVEAQQADGGVRDPHQLELFGTLLSELHAMQKKPGQGESHLVMTLAGPDHPGQLGRDPAPDEGGRPRLGPGLAAATSWQAWPGGGRPKPASSSPPRMRRRSFAAAPKRGC